MKQKGNNPYSEAMNNKKFKAIDISVMVGHHDDKEKDPTGSLGNIGNPTGKSPQAPGARTDLTLHDDVNKSMNDSDELAPEVNAIPEQDKYKKGAVDGQKPYNLLGVEGHHQPPVNPNPVDPEAELARKILASEGEGESAGNPQMATKQGKLSGLHNRAKEKMRSIIRKSGPNNT